MTEYCQTCGKVIADPPADYPEWAGHMWCLACGLADRVEV